MTQLAWHASSSVLDGGAVAYAFSPIVMMKPGSSAIPLEQYTPPTGNTAAMNVHIVTLSPGVLDVSFGVISVEYADVDRNEAGTDVTAGSELAGPKFDCPHAPTIVQLCGAGLDRIFSSVPATICSMLAPTFVTRYQIVTLPGVSHIPRDVSNPVM
jgi:hypothetical protein